VAGVSGQWDPVIALLTKLTGDYIYLGTGN
jgi:hypothetical protein